MREAGDRSDPTGILETFFKDKLGYTDADAIQTASDAVEFLDYWGLTLTPTQYVAKLEATITDAGASLSAEPHEDGQSAP